MLYGPEVEVARTAAEALGSIEGQACSKELQAALGKTSGALRLAVADTCLICAERLLAAGQRDQGMALYAALSAPGIPKPMRLAAMSGIIHEETSTTRPR